MTVTHEVLAVGDCLPGWKAPGKQGPRFDLQGDGPPHLNFLFPHPVQQEVQAFRQAPMRFGLLPVGQHTLFLLVHVPGLLIGWGDAPYALGIVPPESQNVMRPEPDRGWVLTMALADADSGLIHGLRMLTWSPRFSQLLADLIDEQSRHLTSFSQAEHHREIATTYQRYPTADAMVAHAVIVETGGVPFPPTP